MEDTTMQGDYRAVTFGPAFVEQFRLLWMSRRPLLLLLALLGIMALAGEPWSDNPVARLFTFWPLWIVFIGPLWAFAVWHNEGPSNRLYFWSHPVSRTGHSLARLAAGAAWLCLVYATLILAGFIVASLDGEAAQFGVVSAPAWVSFFTGPLLGYLMVSALAVPSDHAIRWFLAILFGTPILLSLLVEWLGLGDVVQAILTPLTDREWGLATSIVAPFAVAMTEVEHAARDMAVTRPEVFDTSMWWLAMPLWVLFWTGVVTLLASRHPDRFPRLRRSA